MCFTFRLYKIHGADWVTIGQKMGRSNSSVCRKYYKTRMEGVCTVHSVYNNWFMGSEPLSRDGCTREVAKHERSVRVAGGDSRVQL